MAGFKHVPVLVSQQPIPRKARAVSSMPIMLECDVRFGDETNIKAIDMLQRRENAALAMAAPASGRFVRAAAFGPLP